MDALAAATVIRETKKSRLSALTLTNTRLLPLVLESVQKGYKVGLISQRVDMLAETPEQIRVQRW